MTDVRLKLTPYPSLKIRLLQGPAGPIGPTGVGVQGPPGQDGQDGQGITDGDKGDISVSSTGTVWTIDADAVTYSKIQNVSATSRFLGRITAAAGNIEELTGTQATSLLNNFTDTLKGLAPLSGGGTDNFLRADGSWSAPPGTGGVPDGDKGDILVSGTGTIWTIDSGVVTLSKQANINTDKLIGRDSASAGIPEELSVGGGIEFTGSGGIQTSAFTGEVTKATGGTSLTIANDAVTYAKIQNISATARFLGRITAGAGDTEELTGTQATTLIDEFTDSLKGVAPASGGGTTNFLRADGTWTSPSAVVADGDKGDITVSSSGAVWTVDNDVISYAKIQNISATSRFLGRITAGAGDAEELTGTQATSLLNNFTDTLKGLAPLSGGGTANFLRADGTWAAPPTGSVSDSDKGDITVTTGGTVWTIDNDAVTYAKMQNVSATDKLLGRSTAGAGDVEEIACTAAGRAILDDANAAAQRATIGIVTGSADNAALRADGTGGATTQGSALIIADTTGALSRSGGGGVPIQGTNTNDAATAGDVGQLVNSVVLVASPVSITNDTQHDITSISLTAGDWDVSAVVYFHGAATTSVTRILCSVSLTSATLDAAAGNYTDQFYSPGIVPGVGADPSTSLVPRRISVASTTTVYLVGFASFSISTATMFGSIYARRVR